MTKNQRHQNRQNQNHPREEREKWNTITQVVRENVLRYVITKLVTILNTKVEMGKMQ